MKNLPALLSAALLWIATSCETNNFLPGVSGVNLSQSSLSFEPGNSATLRATPLPYNAPATPIVWSSTDPDVATVDDQGLVTAVSVGEASIIAAAADKRGICRVIVNTGGETGTLDWLMKGDGTLTLSGVGIIPSYTTGAGAAPWSWYFGMIRSITIGKDVTSIGANAFPGCTALTNITIPAEVTGIGASAFAGCSALAAVTVLATEPPVLDPSAFDGLPEDAVLHVPAGCGEAYEAIPAWNDAFSSIAELEPEEPQE